MYACFHHSIADNVITFNLLVPLIVVTGDANFSMESTCLTVGGFSQPTIARALIEQSGSAEVGLSQRFLWMFPKPSYSLFHTLESVDRQFTDSLGKDCRNSNLIHQLSV